MASPTSSRSRCSTRAIGCGALTLLISTIACSGPAERLLEPDPGWTGQPGERGPYGVELTSLRLSDGLTLGVDTEVALPFRSDGPAGPLPAVVAVQGGFVPVERYRWLAVHLASRGYVVLAPRHPLDLAFFGQDNGLAALRAARRASDDGSGELSHRITGAPASVVGHSLGGVVATKIWLRAPSDEVANLGLLAAIPDPADDAAARTAGRVLALAGSRDEKIGPAEIAAGAAAFDSAQVAVIAGMNHYQYTDRATPDELSQDGAPTTTDASARRAVLTLLDALVDDAAGRAPWPFADPADWPAGVAPVAAFE